MSGARVDSEGMKPAVTRLAIGHRDVAREYAALVAVVALQAVINWHFASQSFFNRDDLLQFQEAAGHGFSLGFLISPALGQFSPGSRLVSWLIQHHAPFDFGVGLGFLLAVHSVGVTLLQRILRTMAGPVWWTYPLTFAYGISLIFLSSLQWFTAGLGRFWVATLSIAAIHAYLCWRRTGRSGWLAWSVVAVGSALLFSFQGLLIPVWLVLIRLLLLDEIRVRDFAKTIGREWRVWLL